MKNWYKNRIDETKFANNKDILYEPEDLNKYASTETNDTGLYSADV